MTEIAELLQKRNSLFASPHVVGTEPSILPAIEKNSEKYSKLIHAISKRFDISPEDITRGRVRDNMKMKIRFNTIIFLSDVGYMPREIGKILQRNGEKHNVYIRTLIRNSDKHYDESCYNVIMKLYEKCVI